MSELDNKIVDFIDSVDKAAQYAKGDANTDVSTPSGPIPSLAKQYAQYQLLIAGLTPDISNRLRVDADGGYTAAQKTQARANIGLDKVDNTTDEGKPVSIAQRGAIQEVGQLALSRENPENRNKENGYVGLSGRRIVLVNDNGDIINTIATQTTAEAVWTFPDKSGTIAMTSDITGTNSGTNTGDETKGTILGKLGIPSLAGVNTGDETPESIQSKLPFPLIDPAIFDQAMGLAMLNADRVVAFERLPNSVKNLVKVATLGDLPAEGNVDTLYLIIDQGLFYHWKGDEYGPAGTNTLGDSDQLAEGTEHLYFTNDRVNQAPLELVPSAGEDLANGDSVQLAISKLGATDRNLAAEIAARELLLNKATDFSVINDTKYPSVKAVQTAIAAAVAAALVGVVVDCGSVDAVPGLFPEAGGTGPDGAVMKGNLWFVASPGTLGGKEVNIGDSIRALVDNPGQNPANWDQLESNIGYVPYNATNPEGYTANFPDNILLDRENHTGTQSADTVDESETRVWLTPAQRASIAHANRAALDLVSGTNTGDQTLESLAAQGTASKDANGGYVGLTAYKINSKNTDGSVVSFLTNSATAARTWTFQDKDGVVALKSDITGTNSGNNTGDETKTSIESKLAGSLSLSPGGTKLEHSTAGGVNIYTDGTTGNLLTLHDDLGPVFSVDSAGNVAAAWANFAGVKLEYGRVVVSASSKPRTTLINESGPANARAWAAWVENATMSYNIGTSNDDHTTVTPLLVIDRVSGVVTAKGLVVAPGPTTAAGAGQPVNITAQSAGSAVAGAGGAINITAGNGNATTSTGQRGGTVTIAAGDGHGLGNGVNVPAAGGNVVIRAGKGGLASNDTATPGTVTVRGGDSNGSGSGGASSLVGGSSVSSVGGNASITGGMGNTGGGNAVVTGGIANNGTGGEAIVKGGDGAIPGNATLAAGSVISPTANGSNVNITASAGGATSGNGGDVNIKAGLSQSGNQGKVNVTAPGGVLIDTSLQIGGNNALTTVTGEMLANKATSITAQVDDRMYPSVKAVKAYVDALGIAGGVLIDVGGWDASGNVFPETGGTGASGAVKKGNLWFVSVAGSLAGLAVTVGDSFRALADNPGQDPTKWDVMETNIGYQPAKTDGTNATGTWPINTTGTVKAQDAANANATYYPALVNAATGQVTVNTDAELTYNPSTNILGVTGVQSASALTLRASGSNVVQAFTQGIAQFEVSGPAGGVSRVRARGGVAGVGPVLEALSSEADAHLILQAKGIGGIIANNVLNLQAGQIASQVDKGTVSAAGTVTFDVSKGVVQKLTVGAALTLAFSGWPGAGSMGAVTIELVNGGSAAVSIPDISWILPTTGAPAASFSAYLTAIGRSPASLQASGTDWLVLWTTNGGNTVYGKLM